MLAGKRHFRAGDLVKDEPQFLPEQFLPEIDRMKQRRQTV